MHLVGARTERLADGENREDVAIGADAEYQASQKLADAADIISAHPIALQLRYLHTLTEIASDNNSTTIFPLPIELLKPFIKAAREMDQ